MKMVSFEIDEKIFAELKKILDKQDKNFSKVMRTLIKSFIEKNGDKQ